MKLLLDTHIFVWAANGDRPLPPELGGYPLLTVDSAFDRAGIAVALI